ncbi:MAG TPA: hypothetical protein PLQ41_00100 [bacterium]|nr:hypothetical protein [bacterium]
MIARMKKFYLFFTGDPSDFLMELQKEGCAEINRLPEMFGFGHTLLTRENTEEIIRKVEFLKNTLKKVEGKTFSGKIILTEKEEEDIIRNFPLDEIYEKFFQITEEIERRKKIGEKISGIKKELFLIKDLTVIPRDLFSMKHFSFCFFQLTKKQKKPDSISGFKVEKIREDEKGILFLVIFPLDKQQEIINRLKEIKGTVLHIRRWNRLPSEILNKIEALEEKNVKAIERLENQLKEISSLKYRILVFYDYVHSFSQYLRATETTGISRFVKGFQGWIKENDIPRMKALLRKNLPDGYLYISDPETGDEIPIALENKSIIEPFEVVTDLYGRPVYKNVDPTPHLSIFFILSFAFCITDAAYGIILMLLSIVFMKKFRYTPGIVKFFRLILYSSIATIFMGAITGSWFGNILSRLPSGSLPVKSLNKLIILNPLEGGNQTFLFLGWALALGYIQILWGLCLNLANSIRYYGLKKSGEPFTLLTIQVLVALIIISFITSRKELIFPLSSLLFLSLISLMILKGLTQKGFMRVFWAFYGAYNVIASNLLGDVLSYSRLFGLGLTTAVLALVVNEMVFMSKGIPFIGYIIAGILFIFGHLANLGINLLGGYVHTSRLQYLEFFTKFFESGGRPFSPLKEARQFTYLNKEKN